MSLMNIFTVAGSALSAQSERLNVTASNLANADSTTGPDGQPYRAKQVVFEVKPVGGARPASGPNVDPVQEMVNMISASRSYQANVETLNTAKNLMLKTLTIGT